VSDRKHPTHDEHGRPIVAELGRAETAQEIADRKAAASAAHRNNQTILNLVIALAASLLVVFVIVVIVVRPDQSGPPRSIDWVSVAKDAQQSVSTRLVVPRLPKSWSANRAELVDAKSSPDGIASWQIGFLTPSTQYIGLVQASRPTRPGSRLSSGRRSRRATPASADSAGRSTTAGPTTIPATSPMRS